MNAIAWIVSYDSSKPLRLGKGKTASTSGGISMASLPKRVVRCPDESVSNLRHAQNDGDPLFAHKRYVATKPNRGSLAEKIFQLLRTHQCALSVRDICEKLNIGNDENTVPNALRTWISRGLVRKRYIERGNKMVRGYYVPR